MYTAYTKPHSVMAAYSAIPLRVYDDNYSSNDYSNYKYSINVVWDEVSATGATPITINGIAFTKLSFDTAHDFRLGDNVLVDDNLNGNVSTGYYHVVEIVDAFSVVINLGYLLPSNNAIAVSKVIPYNLPPDGDGEAKIDLSNVLKDYVSQNLEDVPEIFDGKDTKFCFDLKIGKEYYYAFSFDNMVVTGETWITFIQEGGTSSDIDLNVGDQVAIDITPIEWPFSSTVSYDVAIPRVQLSGATTLDIPYQSTIYVTGQEEFPSYNGFSHLFPAVPPFYDSLVLTKPWFGDSDDNGIAFVYPPDNTYIYGDLLGYQNYNTIVTVTGIEYIEGVGVVVTTNLPVPEFSSWTQAWGGTLTVVNSKLNLDVSDLRINDICVYNARFNNDDYDVEAFDNYVVTNSSASDAFISTILKDNPISNWTHVYNIERETKSWLLIHNREVSTPLTDKVRVTFFTEAGLPTYTTVGVIEIENVSGNNEDWYIPVGIEQFNANQNKVDIFGTFNDYYNDIYAYSITGLDTSVPVARTRYYCFKVNQECSNYSVQHLMWKDALGSWLSFTFKFKSYDNVEVERKTFQQKQGTWKNNTFGYDSYGRGDKQYFTRSKDYKIVNTGWLKQFEVPLIKDLFKSAAVYHQDENGVLRAVVIDNSTIELIKHHENDDMIQYEFRVDYSYNDYRF